MDLPKMERNGVCHHVFVLPVMSKKNNSVIFLKKCTADSGFSSFSRLGARPPIRGGIMLRYPRGMVSTKEEFRFPGFKIPGYHGRLVESF